MEWVGYIERMGIKVSVEILVVKYEEKRQHRGVFGRFIKRWRLNKQDAKL
jgi:hypothetical protein